MQKDLKIGLVIGLILVAVAAVWLSTRPSLSTKARMLRSQNIASLGETAIKHPSFAPNSPNTLATGTSAAIETKQSNLPDFTMHEQRATSNEQQDTRFHIVREGETLSDISYRYYGSANKWQKIREANRSVIRDANKLSPGTKLIIPE